MTGKEKELALYCLKASSDYHSEVCEECIKYQNCDHMGQDNVTETIIKVLEQESCEDCVSRQEVLNKAELIELEDGQSFMSIDPEDVKALSPVTPTQRWIPVSERLPETDGVYIVTRRLFDNQIDTEPYYMVDACYFDGSNTWHNDNRINHERNYLTDIIAWMPLPKPYKAESEE